MRNLFPENKVLQKIKKGFAPVGFFNYIRDTSIMDIAGVAGMDFVIIDEEHATMGRESIATMIMAAQLNGVEPMVRVPDAAPYRIRAYMECGARGILLPNVHTSEDCRNGQRSLRYPPEGDAGCCRFIHSDGYRPSKWMEYLEWVKEISFIPMIEDLEGFHNLDGILAELKPGRDMVLFGKADFGSALGTINPDGSYSAEVEVYLEKTIEKCKEYGIGFMAVPSASPSGMQASDVKKVICQGCCAAVLGTDIGMLADNFQKVLDQCKDMKLTHDAEQEE